MVQEFFSNVTDTMRLSIQHLANADPLFLGLAIGGIALLAYLLLRR